MLVTSKANNHINEIAAYRNRAPLRLVA